MRTAAIIGADSMLGRELAAQLALQGINVLSVGRSDHHEIVLDLREPLSNETGSGKSADVVFHCASSFAGDYLAGARVNFLTNTLGCVSVLELMERLDCRQVVYAGSTWSYKDSELPDAISSYGLSKAEGEQILEWGMARQNGDFCSLRFSQLYDSEGLCCAHQPWFGRIVAYASRGLDLRLPPSTGARNFLHVADAANLMILAAIKKTNGYYPVCHYESLDHTQIAEIAYREFDQGGRILIDQGKKPFRPVKYPADQSLFNNLRQAPRITMAQGLAMIHGAGTASRFGPLDVQ